jgi:hypothetical protein
MKNDYELWKKRELLLDCEVLGYESFGSYRGRLKDERARGERGARNEGDSRSDLCSQVRRTSAVDVAFK